MAGAALAGGFFAASSSSELESSSEDSSLADLARAALAGVTFVAGFFTSLAGEGLTGAALPAGFLAVSSSELESELSELDSCFFAAGLDAPGLAAGDFTGAGFAATFLSSSLLSSLLSEESLSWALLAAGAAGAFWIEAGGGTALYAPALGFLLGGASSSDEESSLLDSVAALFTGVGLAGAGLTGALAGFSSSESEELSSLLLLSCFF